jgi:hypothetical protein
MVDRKYHYMLGVYVFLIHNISEGLQDWKFLIDMTPRGNVVRRQIIQYTNNNTISVLKSKASTKRMDLCHSLLTRFLPVAR